MGTMSIWHWLIVGLIVILLFGKGRMSDFMGDLAKGIKSFKKGMAEDDATPTQTVVTHTTPVQPQTTQPTATTDPRV